MKAGMVWMALVFSMLGGFASFYFKGKSDADRWYHEHPIVAATIYVDQSAEAIIMERNRDADMKCINAAEKTAERGYSVTIYRDANGQCNWKLGMP
jgi:hypothetical protein